MAHLPLSSDKGRIFMGKVRTGNPFGKESCGFRRARRLTATLTLVAFFLYTLAPSYAGGGLVAAPNAPAANRPTVTTAPNGVPVVDIAAPNGAGLSHNEFQDFNIGSNGLVLNNSAAVGQSKLGGLVFGNPNLQGKPSAKLILNEVTSSDPSTLSGPAEVFGPGAEVVIANPNGITCNGCGFINTPRVTLSTGTATVNPVSGQLTGLSVNSGVVTVGQLGLDATTTDAFDIVSRAAQINGAIAARDLGILTGRNDYAYATRTVTAKADDGSVKPQFAIDSSLLGGAYAGKITLVGTEAGVGVRAPTNMAASAGDLTLTADGTLILTNAQSSGAISAISKSGGVEIAGQVRGGTTLTLAAQQDVTLAANAIAGAGGDVGVSGGTVSLGSNATLAAGLNGDGSLAPASGRLTLASQGVVSLGSGALARGGAGLSVSALGPVSNAGALLTGGLLNLSTAQSLSNVGTIRADQGIGVSAGSLTNTGTGTIETQGTFTLVSALLTNQGLLAAGGALNLTGTGAFSNSAGASIEANGALALMVGSLDNEGLVQGNLATSVIASGALTNGKGATLAAGTLLTLELGSLANAGTLSGASGVKAMVSGAATQASGGSILANGTLQLHAASLDNAGALAAAGLSIGTSGSFTNELSGEVQSQSGSLVLTAGGDASNLGKIFASDGLTLNAAGSLTTGAGSSLSVASGPASLGAASLDSRGSLQFGGSAASLAITGITTLEAGSLLTSNGTLAVTGATLNDSGTVQSGEALILTLSQALSLAPHALLSSNTTLAIGGGLASLTNGGTISGETGLTLTGAATLDNESGASLVSGGALSLAAGTLTNAGGIGGTSLTLTSAGFTNAGTLTAPGDITLHTQAATTLAGSSLLTQGNLSFTATTLDNGGTVAAGQGLTLSLAGTLTNRGLPSGASGVNLTTGGAFDTLAGATLVSNGAVMATVNGFDNAGNLGAGTLTLSDQGSLTNEATGRILTGTGGSLSGTSFSNAGLIESNGGLTLRATGGDLTNSGTLFAAQSLDVSASGTLTNTAGATLAAQSGSATLQAGSLSAGGSISLGGDASVTASGSILLPAGGHLEVGGALTLQAASLDAQGTLLSGKSQTLGLSDSLIVEAGSTLQPGGALARGGRGATGGLASLADGGVISGVGAVSVSSGSMSLPSGSLLVSNGALTLTTATLDLSGTLSGASVALTLSGGGLTVEKGGLIDGGTGGTRLTLAGGAAIEGMVASAGALSVNAANLDVTGSLQSGGTQSLTLNGAFSNEGRIFAGDGFTLTTPGSVTNAAGASLIAGQTLGGAVTVTAASITNGGAITFGGSGTLNAGSLSNSGPLVANGVLTLTGLSTLSNSATGLVLGVGGLSITASNSVDNEGGALRAGGDLLVSGPQGSAVGTLTNSSGVIGSASGSVSLTAGTLINQRSNFSVADVLTYDQTFNDVVAIPSLAMILALPTVPGTSAAGEVANGSVAAIYDRFVNPHSSKAEPNGTAVMVTDEDGFVSYYQFGPVRVFATTTQVTGGAAASISAGRNLTISANTITNAESSITAAGNLTLSGSGTLTNSGVELQRQEFFQGSSTSSNNGTNNRCLGGACEQFLQPNQTIEARNDIVGDAAATIQAGGALVVAMGNVVNNSQLGSGVMPAGVIVGVSSIGQPAAVATLTAATPTGLGVGGPAAGLVAAPVSLKAPLTPSRFTAAALNAGGGFAALAVKQVSLAQAQANLATVIPGFSALFTPAPPNASALFETRFDFTQLGPFFGSSFFMNAAGYHPEMLMKTLGDAYFDTALITAEIQAQTGRRWLEPQYSDDSSEMKALLEAGASVARDLHLAEGVGLTPAQVASLTQDVVIYVSENVGGQAVLVPALYLAKNAANLATGPASVLAGRNVTIVSGDSLMNTGTIEAGNNLSILVQNNLTNLSGRITAGGDLSLIARTGDIVNQTFTQDWSAASGLMSHTLVGRTALIEAGGNLTAVAGHDVQILGADLGAGKNLALFAGNDLAIGTIGLKDQFSESGPYGWSSRNNLTQVGSQLSAGGSLGITALNSIDIAGSALSAAKNLQVQAGGSLTVESAQDLIDEQSHYSGGNWTKETVNSTHESVTQLRSVLSAGGDVALTAGTGNLVLASSSIEAGGAVDLSAVNGQILLQARLDTLLQDKSRSGSNMLWQSLADKGERVATAQMVEIEHGGALTAEAGHGIVIDYAVLPPPAP